MQILTPDFTPKTPTAAPAAIRPSLELIIGRPGAPERIRWTVAHKPRSSATAANWAGTFEAPGEFPRTVRACESAASARRRVEAMTLNWVRNRPVGVVIPLLGANDSEVADCLDLDITAIPILRDITTACGLFPDLFSRILTALGAKLNPERGWVFP